MGMMRAISECGINFRRYSMRHVIKKKVLFSIALLSLSMLFLSTRTTRAADEPKARQIMEKVDARDDGDKAMSDMEMILIDKHGNKRVRDIRARMKDFGKDTYRIMFFISPPDVKDTGFLTYDYDDSNKDDDQWLYLPALRKTKRIASSDKSGSFMGSDFNYADMTSRDLTDYDFSLVKEGEVGSHKVWQIQAVPRTRKVIDETGYTKSVLFVRQDNYVVVRGVHWVSESDRLRYYDVKKLELIDDIWVATEVHMTTKQGKNTLHKTILHYRNVRFNQNHSPDLFTVRRLEKGM
jgi:outer membrane lipoprotein-sorting protein